MTLMKLQIDANAADLHLFRAARHFDAPDPRERQKYRDLINQARDIARKYMDPKERSETSGRVF